MPVAPIPLILTGPLTPVVALTSWRWDLPTLAIAAVLGLTYSRATRRSEVGAARTTAFFFGLTVWLVATSSFIGVCADSLFWARALQFVLLFLLVPFCLALGKPVTALRGALSGRGRAKFDQVLGSAPARFLAHPLTTAVAVLATPWLVYKTAWYPAALENGLIDQATRLALVLIGFCYFYSRLQTDPTPRAYPQLLTLLLTVAEVIGDGALGLALWLGPLVAEGHYANLRRHCLSPGSPAGCWGPSLRADQVIGAGIIWVLGDLLGVPFIVAVLRSLGAAERVAAIRVDQDLDQLEAQQAAQDDHEAKTASKLWWEDDPQLRDRFKR